MLTSTPATRMSARLFHNSTEKEQPMTTPIDAAMDAMVIWKETGAQPGNDGLPYATHYGVLHIGELEFRVYQLNTGQRVIDAEDMRAFFEILGLAE